MYRPELDSLNGKMLNYAGEASYGAPPENIMTISKKVHLLIWTEILKLIICVFVCFFLVWFTIQFISLFEFSGLFLLICWLRISMSWHVDAFRMVGGRNYKHAKQINCFTDEESWTGWPLKLPSEFLSTGHAAGPETVTWWFILALLLN